MTDKEYVICEKEDLVAIADAVRAKSGSTESLTVEGLSTAVSNVGGGGGAEIETTDVYVEDGMGFITTAIFTVYRDGAITTFAPICNDNCVDEDIFGLSGGTVTNVIVNSFVTIIRAESTELLDSTNMEQIYQVNTDYVSNNVYKITGEHARLILDSPYQE